MTGKTVPWDSIQTYIATLNDHSERFTSFQKMKSKGYLEVSLIETKLTEPMFQMYDLLCEILNQKNIIQGENEESNKGIETMINTVSNLQESFTAQIALNQQEIRGIIMSMVPQLQGTIRATTSQDAESLLQRVTGRLDENFDNLRSQVVDLESNVVEAIKKEKNQEIILLNQRLEAKDKQIQEMKRDIDNKNDINNNLSSQIEEIKQSYINQNEIVEYLHKMQHELGSKPANCCKCCSKQISQKKFDDDIKELKKQSAQEILRVKQRYESLIEEQKNQFEKEMGNQIRNQRQNESSELRKQVKTVIHSFFKILKLFISERSSEAPLNFKAVLFSKLDAEMSSEVTELLTDMQDLLSQSFAQLQSLIQQLQSSNIQEKPDSLKEESIHQETNEESKQQKELDISTRINNKVVQDLEERKESESQEGSQVDTTNPKNLDPEAQLQSFQEKLAQELQNLEAENEKQVSNPISLPQPSDSDILSSMIQEFLLKSKCATEKKEREYLFKLLGNKRLVTILLFCGSIHGWEGKDFHSRCDQKGATISLFKVKDGDCIGGFTNAQWSSDDNHRGDTEAILFNLSRQRVYPQKEFLAIGCYRFIGPFFIGTGSNELVASEPFNGDNKCCSWSYQRCYYIPREDGKNMLTNKEDGDFTISELEVWGVTFVCNKEQLFTVIQE